MPERFQDCPEKGRVEVDVVLMGIGAVLVLLASVDAVMTTMTAGTGGGPLTTRLGRGLWRLLLRVSGGQSSRLLSYAGALILLTTVVVWVLLLWGGWTLVFLGSNAVVDATTRSPASVPATIYYAGFVVFTLGVGDFVAATGTWQVLTALASVIGLFLITLSITYLVSVVSAAVSRRQLAQSISVLGITGPEIVLTYWSSGQLSSQFASEAQSLRTQLLTTTQQHLAYPVLHFFHSRQASTSAPRSVAALDDALVLLATGVAEDVAPGQDVLGPLQRALEHYAGTVHSVAGGDPGQPPSPPLAPLEAAGLPVVDPGEYSSAAQRHAGRREMLHRIVRSDGWSWPDSGR